MDLHRLTLRAIGPYAGEYTIDFAALRASGVFLLEGPTGSGKSTIIDAIVFALYGGLAGASSSDDRLRSHHAAADVEPYVELVFETGAGIHRIRRSPKWDRPKTRGIGTTSVNMSVVLQRLATPDAVDAETLSTRAQEVGGEIPRILGLTKEQFLQTIVLPQGEFARFLAASGEDRRLVLQSLFGTEIYDRTTAQLGEARRSANSAVETARRGVDEALAGVRVAVDAGEETGDPPPYEARTGPESPLDIDGARVAVARLDESAIAGAAARDELRASLEAASVAHAAETRLAEALARRLELFARRRLLDERTASVAQARSRLAVGVRAASLRPQLVAAAEAETTLTRVRGEVAMLRATADEQTAGDLVDEAVDHLRARREGLLGEIAALDETLRLERGLDEREIEASRARSRLAARRSAVAVSEDGLGSRAAERRQLAAALEASAALAATVDREARDRDDLEAAVEAIRRRDGLIATSGEARDAVAAAAVAAREAVDAEAELRRRRIDGMAGELALALRVGEPCSVCGSTEHPVPAALVDSHPGDLDLDAATDTRTTAEATLRLLRDRAAALDARLDDAETAIVGRSAEDVAAALGAAVEAVRRAEEAAREARATTERLAVFDAATTATSESLSAERLLLAAETARLDSVVENLAVDRGRVAVVLDGRASSCADLAEALRADARRLADVIRLRDELESATTSLSVRRAELDAALDASAFATAEEAEGAVLDPSERSSIENTVAAYDSDAAVVADGLASPEIAALTGAEQADPSSSGETVDRAAAAHAAAADHASRLEDRARRSARALSALESAVTAAAEIAAESHAIVRMADVANASGPENRHGVTLGTYVLLRRFDDVVAAANARLGLMSSGRYQLEVADRESSSRARKAGLALTIRDNATGTTRDPKSFSGGETFYASLSLALGLADVVQAEAGGIQLGTLFVDEGFGTLDPETLDAVMAELGALSAGGRVVGIVSHVDELKQRVADRIEVRRRSDGSSTLTSTAG